MLYYGKLIYNIVSNYQMAFLIVAAILLIAMVSIASFDSKAANAQGNMTSGAKNMTGGIANMTKNSTASSIGPATSAGIFLVAFLVVI